EELRKVNSWFEKNQDRVADFAKELADGMVTAFNAAKKIFGFLFQHRELLMTLAKAMLIAKAGNFMAGPFLAFNKNLGESALALDSNVKGLKGFGAALGPAIQALTAGLALGTVIDKALGLSDSISDTLSGYEKGPRKIENKHGDSLEGKIRNQLDQQKENFRVINNKLAEARKKDKWVAGFGGKRLKEGEMGKAEAKVMEKYKGDFEILENT
ncbi:MAG: hypothetical protein GY822_21405, partial [Deltaproteobacteria bacterium]|nr:hypothetical protein [Deltaproteobacteria bacterium]